MVRAIEILAIIVFIIILASLASIPWPGNFVLGAVALVTLVTIIIYELRARKRGPKAGPEEEDGR